MASFSVSVPHSLGQEAAQKRVEQFLDSVQREYAAQVSDVNGEWTDNRLAFRFATSGLKISGSLVVEPQTVEVSGPLPLVASLFRGTIENQVRDQLQKLLCREGTA